MTDIRRRLIILYLLAVAFLCTYVPWKIESQGTRASVGYSFIWSPADVSFSVDFARLVLEIVTVTLLMAIVYIVLNKSGKNISKVTDDSEITTEDINEIREAKRKPLVALLLSAITPGLGQVYNGQLKKGIVLYLASLLSGTF